MCRNGPAKVNERGRSSKAGICCFRPGVSGSSADGAHRRPAEVLACVLGVSMAVLYAGALNAAENADKPGRGGLQLFADAHFSVYERAVINLANLAIEDGKGREAVHLLEGILETKPLPEVASLVHLHLFRIHRRLLGDDDAALKDAVLVGPRHIPQVLRDLTWGMEREGEWKKMLEVFLRLLPGIDNSESKVITAEWLLNRMDRSGDEELQRRAAQAVIDHVSPEEARAVTVKRAEERRKMTSEHRRGDEREVDGPRDYPRPERRREPPSPPSRNEEDIPGLPGF